MRSITGYEASTDQRGIAAPGALMKAHSRLTFVGVIGAMLCASLGVPDDAVADDMAPTACAVEAERAGWRPPGVRTVKAAELDFDAFVDSIADSQVVFVGELHDRFDHHLNQLEIICRLHERDPGLVIGMEFFQWPAQPHLDEYIAGRTDESVMLRDTGYYETWRYDYRLYQPILEFARRSGIPLVALNVSSEITRKVGREGIAGLNEEERASIPVELDRSDKLYRARIEKVFEQHPARAHGDFESFFEVQLLWDEGMAQRTADYLKTHGGRMVVLAGGGHVVRSGIPQRFSRRHGAQTAVVLQADADASPLVEGDYVLISAPIDLPPAGMLGVMLESTAGSVSVTGLAEDSAAQAAGIRAGDSITGIDGRSVREFADVKLALLDKRPGDTVLVEVDRVDEQNTTARVTLAVDVTLR